MYKIRTVKTSSGAIAVQVVEYFKNRRTILLHVGSARDKKKLLSLKESALCWIEKNNPQRSLFPLKKEREASSLISLDKCQYLGFRYQLLYDTLWKIGIKLKFHLIPNSKILNDLVIARIAYPSSKLESFEFIFDYFGIKHHRTTFYRQFDNTIINMWKDEAKVRAVASAKKYFSFNFSLVFYDLTTLYFESERDNEEVGLRKIGFSKDNKSSNPQIMIGLLVNDQGFPISYQIFPGNKFEGHTLIPSILSLKKKYKIKNMTIVADSAMISDENISLLKAEDLNYIVAARTANLPLKTIEETSKLNKINEATIRIETESKGSLILHFSNKRYAKEKREMEKQLDKANYYLKHPNAAEIIKRTKFLKGNKSYELNQELIDKTTLLLGVKGYYSNCSLSDLEIVKQYKNLWHVEKAFRISKSDLKARPVFHSKSQTIEVHILICFMALCIAKYTEIKTGKSIRSIVKILKKITDARIYDQINQREFIMRSEINNEIKKDLELILPH